MIFDEDLKKGDFVKYKDKTYEISHSVSKYHDKICIWINKKTKTWNMVDRNSIEKIGVSNA